MNRQLRARIVLEEARALGLDLDDLVAAATGEHRPIAVAAWIDEIAPTFGPSTARTFRPYWRLLATMHGDRALAALTTMDLAAVVDAAGERAKTHWPDSTGRSSRESCIAAIRSLYTRGPPQSTPAMSPPTRPPRSASHAGRPVDGERSTIGS
jgi:hypothetical protein